MLLILRDTREQRVLDFSHCAGVDRVEDIGMPFGDYAGMIGENKDSLTQIPMAWDRKSINDLFGTMTKGYDRWKACMERAKQANHKLILIVEGTYEEVRKGCCYSQFSGDAMIKKLATLYVKYELETWFCENRAVMASRIVDTLLAVDRCWAKEKKGGEVK